jgi:hypothetical protein
MEGFDENIDDLIIRNKFTYSVQVKKLEKLLSKVKPKKGNFLFTDIVGRIIWNACATAKGIELLLEQDYDFGVRSMTRKLFECQILLMHLFQSDDPNKEIARVMAYSHDWKKNVIPVETMIEDITKIVNGFGESKEIIEHFKIFINGKKGHWHWTGKTFAKIIKDSSGKTSEDELNELETKTMLDYLGIFHQGAHVDLMLNEDLLSDSESGEIQYKDPFRKSKTKLFGFIGIARMTIQEIISLTEKNWDRLN